MKLNQCYNSSSKLSPIGPASSHDWFPSSKDKVRKLILFICSPIVQHFLTNKGHGIHLFSSTVVLQEGHQHIRLQVPICCWAISSRKHAVSSMSALCKLILILLLIKYVTPILSKSMAWYLWKLRNPVVRWRLELNMFSV